MKRFVCLFFSVCCIFAAHAKSIKVLVGDYYENNGLKGIVVKVDSGGEHGLIMSLRRCAMKWINYNDESLPACAYDKTDGQKNMEAVEKWISDNGKSWSMFPFLQWCRNLGDGWYAPSVDELKLIIYALNGDQNTYSNKQINHINKQLKKHGGEELSSDGYLVDLSWPLSMFSSTEGEAGFVYTLEFISTNASLQSRHNSQKNSKVLKVLSGFAGMEAGNTHIRPDGKFEIVQRLKSYTGKKSNSNYGSRAIHKF